MMAKFNNEDIVWPIYDMWWDKKSHYHLQWHVRLIEHISEIRIEAGSVEYYFESDQRHPPHAPEYDCFLTEEEAQAECDRRNEEKGE